MKLLLILTVSLAVGCTSSHQIKENLYMVDCDGLFGDCVGEMKKRCPKGYQELSMRKVHNANNMRKEIHFECLLKSSKAKTE